MSLIELVKDQIWYCCYPIKFGPIKLSCRMTVVRLNDGSLWVHSPIPINRKLREEIFELGKVSTVVAPNLMHNLFFQQFLKEFPEARGYIAPGMSEKHEYLMGYEEISAKLWTKDFESIFILGLPVLNETVWFHRASSTLIVTDLVFCFAGGAGFFGDAAAKLLGVYQRLGMSRTMKLMIKDKAKFTDTINAVKMLPVETIVLAHDQIISENAKERFGKSFDWLFK